jgi:hypothetical protein
MTTEEQLQGWTGPSSTTEQDKQERTQRMVTEAIEAHNAFDGYSFSVYAKGSYANQTNVRTDSDVDIVVQCHEVVYWREESAGAHPASSSYSGTWTPKKLREEVVSALKAKFPSQVDTSGSTAIFVHSSSARVDADVVPSFNSRYYFTAGGYREGTRTYRTDNTWLENYPVQHLANGRAKNTATSSYFKQAVRILKRVENLMVTNGVHREVPSYFVECLVYNCPDSVLLRATWVDTMKGVLVHIWDELQGDTEPTNNSARWLEVNECKYLFTSAQKWSRKDGRDFAKAAWNYLGFAS